MIEQFILDDIVEESRDLWCVFINDDRILKINLLDIIDDIKDSTDDINKLIGEKFVLFNNKIHCLYNKNNVNMYSCLSSGGF